MCDVTESLVNVVKSSKDCFSSLSKLLPWFKASTC